MYNSNFFSGSFFIDVYLVRFFSLRFFKKCFKYFNKFIFLSLCCLSWNSHAEKPPEESWTFTFQFENDLFADTDRFYTNGIKLSWISPEFQWFHNHPYLDESPFLKTISDTISSHLPYRDKERQRHIAFSIGQKMYTPQDISRRDLINNDRPYGGWLYGSAAFHTKTRTRLDTFELQLGFTGDLSLGEEAQDLVHSIRDIEKANGWDNQIDTEVGINLIYDRKYRFFSRDNLGKKFGTDGIFYGGAALGNIFTHINSGVEIRFGWNLPSDFGTALIRPAGDTNAPADKNDPRYKTGWDGFSFHVFAATNGRLVLRDIFLDGNTFSNSHDIDKENWVGDFVAGASMTWSRFKLSYSQVLRTKEFKSQQNTQKFGSINLSYTF